MSGIKYSFYNSNLFSGSSDKLRTAVGGYWQLETEGDFDSVVTVFTSVADNSTTDAGITTLNGPIVGAIKSGYLQATTSSADIVVPSFKMPIRIVGNGDVIENDFDWESKINGVIPLGVSGDNNFEIEALYAPLYIKRQDYDNLSTYKLGKINYSYNYYLPTYQNFIDKNGETSIPNYYLYVSKYIELDEAEAVDNYVSVEGSVDPQSILNKVETTYPPTYDVTAADIELTNDTFYDKFYLVKKYLSSSFSVEGAISSSTVDAVSRLSENLYFNKQSFEVLSTTPREMSAHFPFMVTLNFPAPSHQESRPFGEMILDSGYENLMLNYIKKRFVDKISRIPNNIYRVLGSNITSSAGSIHEISSHTVAPIGQVDFFTMPMDTLKQSSVPNLDNFYIVGGQNDDREKIVNTDGINCYSHSIPSLKLIESVKKYLSDDFYFSNTSELLLKDILDKASSPAHSEVIAYRIQKSAGTRAIDAPPDAIRQNFIISSCAPQSMLDSSENRSGLTIYDSQVKYGEPYSYAVYAYVVVYGYDYVYSDLVIGREIANTEDAESNTVHCLEFFNPASGEASPALYSEDIVSEETDNSLFTEAQISSYDKYLADFNISVEPSIKIIEIPIFNKVVTVLDHPLQSLNTHKFQRMNDSKIIGFFNNIEPFVPKKYPSALTIDDSTRKSVYLGSNDLLSTEKIDKASRGRPSSVQVFRKREKPKSISDFSKADLITEKSLKINNSPFVLSNCLYEEKINVNTKYYYVFRMRNENRAIGQITNVIEAELIDDGGYLYSVFEEYEESELHTAVESQISEQFKKLIHLIPNINQISFDDTNVNYDNSAASEIDNLKIGTLQDSIFGKTFKIRLTSKKTGKKIDLNVAYKLI